VVVFADSRQKQCLETYSLGSRAVGTPVYRDGVLYVAAFDGLWALDAIDLPAK
jgi:hypothetical protein